MMRTTGGEMGKEGSRSGPRKEERRIGEKQKGNKKGRKPQGSKKKYQNKFRTMKTISVSIVQNELTFNAANRHFLSVQWNRKKITLAVPHSKSVD